VTSAARRGVPVSGEAGTEPRGLARGSGDLWGPLALSANGGFSHPSGRAGRFLADRDLQPCDCRRRVRIVGGQDHP
jgi:hypothetical protein